MAQVLLAQGMAQHLPLQDKSVHMVCTSPPYFGLRSYTGVEPSCWPGGSYTPVPGAPPIRIPGPTPKGMATCDHQWQLYSIPPGHCDNGITSSTLQGGKTTQAQTQRTPTTGATCRRCECWRGTLGNETDVPSYIWHTLLWLREVRRCLRDDGAAWVVLGDSFAGNNGYNPFAPSNLAGSKQSTNHGAVITPRRTSAPVGYPQGALLGIPGLVHQAALADGWVVRDEVVWVKVAPMPESIRGTRHEQTRCKCVSHKRGIESWRNGSYPDRPQSDHDPADMKNFAPAQADPACATCGGTGRLDTLVLRRGSWRHTRATETILQLTKGMDYWSNGEGVKEPGSPETGWDAQRRHGTYKWSYTEDNSDPKGGGLRGLGGLGPLHSGTRNPRGYSLEPPSAPATLAALLQWLTQHCPDVLAAYEADAQNPVGVLQPTPQSFAGAHFAVFPQELVERLIKATCPERCCPTCGEGWAATVTDGPLIQQHNGAPGTQQKIHVAQGAHGVTSVMYTGHTRTKILHGLLPSCAHYCTCDATPCRCGKLPLSAYHPGIVMDCFAGSGTTLLVSRALGRQAIGIDASWPYLHTIARQRLGLTDLAAWQGDPDPPRPTTYTDLPLFTQR